MDEPSRALIGASVVALNRDEVEEQIAHETVESLAARLEAARRLLVRKSINRELLFERALITPACGLGSPCHSPQQRAPSR